MSKYSGECYCGTIKFYCDGDPFFTQYCHCNKCREVASQSKRDADKKGYAWTAGYLTSCFHITSASVARTRFSWPGLSANKAPNAELKHSPSVKINSRF